MNNALEYYNELYAYSQKPTPEPLETPDVLEDHLATKTPVRGYKVPCKAFYDAFHCGLVKCVVLEYRRDNESGNCPDSSTNVHCKIKITSHNKYFKYGEIIENVSGLHVFPREAYHATGIFKYRVSDFRWEI